MLTQELGGQLQKQLMCVETVVTLRGKNKARTRRTNAKHTITLLKSQSDIGRKTIIIYDKMSDYYYYYYYYYYYSYAWLYCFHLLYSCKY
jgi:hypothetical protein